MLYFAYDGTINGDWVSHYAVRMASHYQQRQLRLIHIDERTSESADRNRRIERIAGECERLSVKLVVDIRAKSRDVFSTLQAAIPAGSDTFLVCGTRMRGRYRGYLAGSVGERFLAARRCNALVLRVVHPGKLGAPRTVLAPVSGHLRGFISGLPFLKLLTPNLTHLHFLHVKRIGRFQFRRLSPDAINCMRRDGVEYCQRIEREATGSGGLGEILMDAHAAVSDDVSAEIILQANRLKAGLIYVGATERTWAERLLLGSPMERVSGTLRAMWQLIVG